MIYSNEKIKKLIQERDDYIIQYNREIENEIEKERVKHKFSWKRFLLLIGVMILPLLMIHINLKIFPKTSIWSWGYYIK